MHRATSPLKQSHDLAYVCFLRPSNFGAAATFRIFDAQQRFLGEAVSGSYWTVPLEQGEHWLYSWGENVTVVNANVLAGRTYYVVVRPRLGVLGARVQLTALAPRSEDWAKLGDWLSESEELVADTSAGQRELDSDLSLVHDKMFEAVQVWRRMNAREREVHTLHPSDGTVLR